MPHSKELLGSIAARIAADYPGNAGYELVFEKQLSRTRMMPDIAVMRAGRPICVVEIGYTRPEKLTAYREMKIPDVRWYDKSGVLHADVLETVMQVKVHGAPSGQVAIYAVEDWVPCLECAEEELPESTVQRYARRFGYDAESVLREKRDEEACAGVSTWLITDYVSLWLPTFCDKCGRPWFADPEDDGLMVASACYGKPVEIARELGTRRELTSWSEACERLERACGLTLNYFDGQFIDEESERDVRTRVHIETERLRAAERRSAREQAPKRT
jgi:hypothetical protein